MVAERKHKHKTLVTEGCRRPAPPTTVVGGRGGQGFTQASPSHTRWVWVRLRSTGHKPPVPTRHPKAMGEGEETRNTARVIHAHAPVRSDRKAAE